MGHEMDNSRRDSSDSFRFKKILSVVDCIVYINLMYVLGAIDEPEDLFKNVLQIVLSFCLLTL